MQENVYRRAELGDHRSYVESDIVFGFLDSEFTLMINNFGRITQRILLQIR